MPATRRKPADYVFRSIRVFPDFWAHIELLAGREQVSVNSLINALLDLSLEADQTDEGRAAIHAACRQWRTRWETKGTARRKAQAAADETLL
jgi:predicted DNA-binding ribbon-helix-helix protein